MHDNIKVIEYTLADKSHKNIYNYFATNCLYIYINIIVMIKCDIIS